jgi:hypothetical protein
MITSDKIGALSKALVAALGAVTGVTKDSKNPHFKNDYASLEAVTEMARPILAANGLCVVQSPGAFEGNRIPVKTRIIHESGEWIEGEIVIPLSKADAQGAGSAVTYARRYALMAMLGVAPVDDDGEAAVERVPANKAPKNGLGTEPRDGGAGSIEGVDWWKCSGNGLSAAEAKRQGLEDDFNELRHAFRDTPTVETWKDLCRTYADGIGQMPKAWRTILRSEADARLAELETK